MGDKYIGKQTSETAHSVLLQEVCKEIFEIVSQSVLLMAAI